MKTKLAVLITGLLFAVPLIAQTSEDSYSDGIYGYTSLDYDSESNTMTAYSETDIDSDLLPYYGPRLNVNVTDNQNHNYNSSCRYVGPYTDYEDVTCQFTPGSGSQYTASASHWAQLNYYYSSGCGGNLPCGSDGYIDYWNFQQLEYYQETEWLGQDWFAPGPEGDNTTYSPDIILGGTMDQAQLQADPVCGDGRDRLISEYTSFLTYNSQAWRSTYKPQCADFVTPSTWNYYYYYYLVYSYFNFSELTTDQTTEAGSFAVLQPYAYVSGLNAIGNQVVARSAPYGITSAYRNPAAEIAAANANGVRPAPTSRHEAGDGCGSENELERYIALRYDL